MAMQLLLDSLSRCLNSAGQSASTAPAEEISVREHARRQRQRSGGGSQQGAEGERASGNSDRTDRGTPRSRTHKRSNRTTTGSGSGFGTARSGSRSPGKSRRRPADDNKNVVDGGGDAAAFSPYGADEAPAPTPSSDSFYSHDDNEADVLANARRDANSSRSSGRSSSSKSRSRRSSSQSGKRRSGSSSKSKGRRRRHRSPQERRDDIFRLESPTPPSHPDDTTTTACTPDISDPASPRLGAICGGPRATPDSTSGSATNKASSAVDRMANLLLGDHARALCFASPVKDSKSQGDDDDHTLNTHGDDHTLNTHGDSTLNTNGDDTMTSTVYFDAKLAHMVENSPPMPLYRQYEVEMAEEDAIHRIIETNSHRSLAGGVIQVCKDAVQKMSSSSSPNRQGGGGQGPSDGTPRISHRSPDRKERDVQVRVRPKSRSKTNKPTEHVIAPSASTPAAGPVFVKTSPRRSSLARRSSKSNNTTPPSRREGGNGSSKSQSSPADPKNSPDTVTDPPTPPRHPASADLMRRTEALIAAAYDNTPKTTASKRTVSPYRVSSYQSNSSVPSLGKVSQNSSTDRSTGSHQPSI